MTLRMSGKVRKQIHCKGSLLFVKQNNKMRAVILMKVRAVNQLVYLGVGGGVEERTEARDQRERYVNNLYKSYIKGG